MPSVYTMPMKSQLRWAGHKVRMLDHRLPKKVLFDELQEGKRSRGAPEKRFKDSLKAFLKTFTIDHDSWEAEAQDIRGWRAAIYEGATRSEASRTYAAEQRRQARKDSAKSSAAATIPCPHCPRLFQARIGLKSHLRTHLTYQTPPPRRLDNGHRRHRRTNDIFSCGYTKNRYNKILSLFVTTLLAI